VDTIGPNTNQEIDARKSLVELNVADIQGSIGVQEVSIREMSYFTLGANVGVQGDVFTDSFSFSANDSSGGDNSEHQDSYDCPMVNNSGLPYGTPPDGYSGPYLLSLLVDGKNRIQLTPDKLTVYLYAWRPPEHFYLHYKEGEQWLVAKDHSCDILYTESSNGYSHSDPDNPLVFELDGDFSQFLKCPTFRNDDQLPHLISQDTVTSTRELTSNDYEFNRNRAYPTDIECVEGTSLMFTVDDGPFGGSAHVQIILNTLLPE